MSFHIRPAQLSDATAIARNNQALAAEIGDDRIAGDRLLEGVHAVLDDPARGFYLVAEAGAAVVGQLLVTYEWSDWRNGVFWWIKDVYVAPDLRGHGLARNLCAHALEMARATSRISGVRVCVANENQSARSVCEELGMSPANYRFYELDLALDTPGECN